MSKASRIVVCAGIVPDPLQRFAASVPEAEGAAWVAGAAQRLWGALPRKLILDWDSPVQTKYGRQEGAAVGYNPQKRGRKSFQPLLAVAAGTRLCPYYRFRSGDTVTATQWDSAMEECQSWLGKAPVWRNRGDPGLGHERICAWHEARVSRPHYLFRLKLTANVKRAIVAVPTKDWQGPARLGVLQVAEVSLRLPDWSCARRVVVGRRCLGEVSKEVAGTFGDETRHEFEAYVTSLPAGEVNAWQIIELYRQRADTENVFDELKHQWGLDGFCRAPSAKRATEDVASKREWTVVGTVAGRLPAGLRLVGSNCAAVENPVAGRADPASNWSPNLMKIHPPTAESRFKTSGSWYGGGIGMAAV
jgi:hypothetical protein